MSFQSIEFDGKVKETRTVEVSDVKASEVVIECNGETVTIKGKIKQIMRSNGTAEVASVEVTEPGRTTYTVNSLNSNTLKNPDGSDRVETPGTTYKPVPGGKAY